MFPHTITLFNVIQIDSKIIYHRCVVSDVFHYETQTISKDGKGEKISSIYNVIFSNIALKNYVEKLQTDSSENVFTLKENDIIVYDEFKEIEDLLDIQKSDSKYFLIKSISDNRVGLEELQNIMVSG